MQQFRERDEESNLAARLSLRSHPAEKSKEKAVEPTTESAFEPPAVRGFWKALRSENPILAKELRALYLPAKESAVQRKLKLTVNGIAMVALYAAALLGMREILKNVSPNDYQSAWFSAFCVLMGLQSVILIGIPISRLPLTISKEREKQTWNALLLSRLSPETILSGKYAAGLSASLGALAFFLPLAALAAFEGGAGLFRFVLGYAVLIATSVLLSMTSVYASWKHATSLKASNEAGGWMAAICFGAAGVWGLGYGAILLGQYLLFGSAGQTPPPILTWLLTIPTWLNPFVALFATLFQAESLPTGWNAMTLWALPLVYLTFAGTVTVSLWRKMIAKFWSAPRDFTG